MLDHIAYLAQPAGDNRLTHCHVFEQFRRRTEKFAAVGKRYMRRYQNIACVEQSRNAIMSYKSRKYNPIQDILVTQFFFNLGAKPAVADEKETDRGFAR